MSAQDDEYTYDRAVADGGAYVPDVDDLGGANLADDAQNPPQQGVEPYAGMLNEVRRNVAGLNRCAWWTTIWVEYSGGSYAVTAVDAMGTLVDIATFTPTSGATGVIVITWTAGAVPAQARTPRAWLTGAHGFAYAAATGAAEVTVYLKDTAGADDDLDFAVELR